MPSTWPSPQPPHSCGLRSRASVLGTPLTSSSPFPVAPCWWLICVPTIHTLKSQLPGPPDAAVCGSRACTGWLCSNGSLGRALLCMPGVLGGGERGSETLGGRSRQPSPVGEGGPQPLHTSVLGFFGLGTGRRQGSQRGTSRVGPRKRVCVCGGGGRGRPAPPPHTSGPRMLTALAFRGPQHFMSAHLPLEESAQNRTQTSPN